jgi:Na+-driven multidrug efflux pump
VLCILLEQKVAAVAIATLVANVVGAVLTVAHLLRLKDGPCRVDIRNLQISASEIKSIVLLGLPNAFTTAIYSISNLQIQSAINSFGSSAAAGNNASAQVETFVATIVNAVSTTAMVAVGQNLGAGYGDRVRSAIVRCLIMNTVVSLILGYTALAFGRPLLRIFVPNDTLAVDIGRVRLMCLLSIYFVMAIDSTLSSSVRAFGNTLLPMLNSVVTVVLFRTVWMNFIYPNMTFVGDPIKDIFNVYECYIISWIMSLAVQIVIFFAVYKRYMKEKIKVI